MIRRILVPLDNSPYSAAATSCACAIAEGNEVELTGMAVLDSMEIATANLAFHEAIAPEMLRRARENVRDAEATIAEILKQFSTTCEAKAVVHHESELQGVPSKCILETATCFDLMVMGLKTFYHFETRTGSGDSLRKVLNHTTTPLLAVPKHHGGAFKKVLVAFDASPGSTRALRALATFAPLFDFEVTALMSDKDSDRAAFYLREAVAFLHAHGVEKVVAVSTADEIGQVIDEDYIESVDLVVAGVHGRRRLKDFFVGSLTTRLIDYGHRALLLGQ